MGTLASGVLEIFLWWIMETTTIRVEKTKSASGVMVPFENSHRDADTFKNGISVLTPACPCKPNAQRVLPRDCQFWVLSWDRKGKWETRTFRAHLQCKCCFCPSSLVATLYDSVCLGGRLHVYCCSWLAGDRWHHRHHCRNDANYHI